MKCPIKGQGAFLALAVVSVSPRAFLTGIMTASTILCVHMIAATRPTDCDGNFGIERAVLLESQTLQLSVLLYSHQLLLCHCPHACTDHFVVSVN